MDSATIIDMTLQCMLLVLILSMPPIVVAAVTGVLVSLFQALTQVQEQTLSFAIKLLAVFITLVMTSYWLGAELYSFTIKTFDVLPVMTK